MVGAPLRDASSSIPLPLTRCNQSTTLHRCPRSNPCLQFDAAPTLDSDAAVAAYLTDILEANDPALLAAALGDIARARGMSEIAKASGPTRTLDLDLKDLELSFAHTHARMATVSQICNYSVALSGAVLAAVVAVATSSITMPLRVFLVLPLPFFVFALLTLREDLLLAHHDLYIYSLRARCLRSAGLEVTDSFFRLLPDTKHAKAGRLLVYLTALRYSPVVMVLVPCILWYSANAKLLVSWTGVVDAILLLTNLILAGVLAIGMQRVLQLHRRVEVLVPNEVKRRY